ncbi:double-strand break repair protein MRE11 isoform X2 [Megalopta genalis]|uniref:double-strand break repair protein MRE11 isoform X2 n=1 Tax=Megalopta genalis TaxID=115081 RepID=UPI003FD2A3ED
MSPRRKKNYGEKLNSEDTIKILVATDIHLDYNFNKKRGQESDDTFITFEEILQYGHEHEVDFILLGGDLFHDTKPSQSAMLKCMELLRKYCLGSRPIKIQFLSDPELIFQHCPQKTVNYGGPNVNISIPIFSIHGNHDDPSFAAVGSMDLLSISSFINYFGKSTDLTHITIPPLILKKGNTHLALYGLGYINDARLSRLLRDSKVDMLQPKNINCFNLFVLHQNRAPHLEYGHIPETKLPDFLDFIIWGHEHECRITPEFISERAYYISQPGSSVATSLCEGEARTKHIGLLSINGKSFKMKKLQLRTVRPFVFDNLILDHKTIQNDNNLLLSDSVYNFVDDYIENKIIPKAVEQLSNHPKQPVVPLIRLRIFHTKDEEVFDTIKLAQKYCEVVANPLEMILFRKKSSSSKRSSSKFDDCSDIYQNMADIFGDTEEDQRWSRTVEGELKKYFSLEENKNLLTVLTVDSLNEALTQFINKGDSDAFKNLASHQMEKIVSHLETSEVTANAESIEEEIKSFVDKRKEKAQDEDMDIQTLSITKPAKPSTNDEVIDVDSRSDSADEAERLHKVPSRRGRGRGRGARNRSKETNKSSFDITTKTSSTSTKKQTKTQDQTLSSFVMRGINLNEGNKRKAKLIDTDSE